MSTFRQILNPSYTKTEKAKHWPVEFEPPFTDIRHAKSKKRFDIKAGDTICERECELPTYTFPLKVSYYLFRFLIA